MERFVVSRELAERLKAAGYPQETEYYWLALVEGWKLVTASQEGILISFNKCAAPLSDELLEALPEGVEVRKVLDGYAADPPPECRTRGITRPYLKTADALAELYLFCKENGYIGTSGEEGGK